ncbi:PEP-CTERM sorting domain-containing protein [Teredinibacter sp. KSP-S5-2]|uniref:PEP-CTERM sorting domain-containing protein n=1 Tax=Teredinibacter sp. KSP-S5-2 TaxID=3034506 RepID=UPI002934A1C6|nr:PEP-CTERM sorting domain-containing protein [Teredinibacter sp. KSP-S5-2]WNO11573.1 PEP-CTERM sorting domain-containing protein [Teredinibacter sp. KSP-S5-2]
MLRLAYKLILSSALLCLLSTNTSALVVQEYSAFLNSSTLGVDSYTHSGVGGYGADDFIGSGLDLTFTSTLDANGLGSATWSITNNTGSVLEDVRFFVFLDAEIDQAVNTFFNESGALVSVDGAGAADNRADMWEIDEPGYVFGNIYDNLLAGALDNTNEVPAGLEDDVSMALGFEIGNLNAGDAITGVFETSLLNIGGLSHSDFDSNVDFFFNGYVDIFRNVDVSVPEPGSLALFMIGFLGLVMSRRVSR